MLVFKARRRQRSWVGVSFGALLCLGVARTASAQWVSETCASPQGETCTVKPAPLGTPCGCFTKTGPSQGQIVSAPPANASGPSVPPPQTAEMINNTCRTVRGFCQTYPAALGSPCVCFGDPGTVITRPPDEAIAR